MVLDVYNADAEEGRIPAWLDVCFCITISVIHAVYTLKFTTFSLGYIYARWFVRQSLTVHLPTHSNLYLYIYTHTQRGKEVAWSLARTPSLSARRIRRA